MLLPRGLLIAIEGIDGAGKTTQASMLRAVLERAGLDVVSTKEPTDGSHGLRIKRSSVEGRMSPREELDAFLLDRREHVAGLIAPALTSGKVVIIDRYYFSTAAYQGIRGLDPHELLALNESFAPQPDLLAVLDVPAQVGVARVRSRGGTDGNLFERLGDLERAGAIFRAMRRPYLALLDGTLAPERLAIALRDLVQDLLDEMLCPKAPAPCEPMACSFRLAAACPVPALGVSDSERGLLARSAAIASDPSLDDSERIDAIRKLAVQ